MATIRGADVSNPAAEMWGRNRADSAHLLYPLGNRQNSGGNFVFFLYLALAGLEKNLYYYFGRGRWIPLGLPGRPVSDPPNPAFSVKKPGYSE